MTVTRYPTPNTSGQRAFRIIWADWLFSLSFWPRDEAVPEQLDAGLLARAIDARGTSPPTTSDER